MPMAKMRSSRSVVMRPSAGGSSAAVIGGFRLLLMRPCGECSCSLRHYSNAIACRLVPRRAPMFEVYYWPTPNGKKVTILLEECGLEYKITPVNIQKGDQFNKDFLRMNPNHRMPVIVDHAPKGGGAPVSVFESGAIMMYIAEKTGKFWP